MTTTTLDRLRALERELRDVLGDDVIDDVVASVTARCAGDDVERRRGVGRARERSLSPVRGTRARSPSATLRETNANDIASEANEEWDPYRAFLAKPGRGRAREEAERSVDEEARTRETMGERAAFALPVAESCAMTSESLDQSLARVETSRRVSDVVERARARVESKRAPSAAYETRDVARGESGIFIEDITDEDDDDEQGYAHQYTREDAEAILKRIESDEAFGTGIWRASDDEEPRPSPVLAPHPRRAHAAGVEKLNAAWTSRSTVESLSEFKTVLNAVFDERDEND